MELTGKTLQEVRFSINRKNGYEPGEVDEFIEAVAEGVEELQERLRRANERVAQAEQQLAEATAGGTVTATSGAAPIPPSAPAAIPEDNQVRGVRVLEMAQRTADAAIAEAQAEAEQLTSQSRTEAEQLKTESKAEAERLIAEARQKFDVEVARAQEEASRIATEAQGQLRADVSQLESARAQLQADVEALSKYLDEERARLRQTLTTALAALDDHVAEVVPPPQVGNVEVPAAPAVPAAADTSSPSTPSSPTPSSATPPPANSGALTAEADNKDEHDNHDEHQVSGEDQASNQDEEPAEPLAAAEAWWGGPQPWTATSQEPVETPAPGAWGSAWGGGDSGGDTAHGDHPEGQVGGDPFLAELRRAVQEDQPLGPRDGEGEHGDGMVDDLYGEGDDKSGFFRRKK